MFPLLRHFSIACAIVLAIGTAVVAWVVSEVTTDQLIAQREASNVALTRAFSNSIWPAFRDHVRQAADLDGDQLRAHEEAARLSDAVRRLTNGLSIVKIKVYAMNGATVFSTQASQMGENKAGSPGFVEARSGRVATEISHRDVFSAFEQEAFDIDVVASYVPIYDGQGEVEGIFEVYDDVTATLAQIHWQRDWTILVIGGLFAALYLILFLIVRYAARLMRRQHDDILAAQARLAEANADLASEVATRREAQDALRKSNETLKASEAEARALLARIAETTEALAVEKKENEMQRQFVSMVSHEFRTPLAIIDGSANRLNRLLGACADDRSLDKIHKIRSSVTRMTTLIEDTLYADKAFSERLAPQLADCAFKTLIDQVCDRLRNVWPDCRIDVDLDDAPDTIVADPKLLDHVFTNLLSNAIKYSPDDRICAVRCRRDGDALTTTISDHGVGIPEDEIPRLFERYFRASSAAGIPGTGIGLNLARKLVEMHGGAISVRSALGEGSEFTIRLPLAGPPQAAAAAA